MKNESGSTNPRSRFQPITKRVCFYEVYGEREQKKLVVHSLFFTRIRTCVFPLLEAKILLLHPQEVADDAIGEEDARLGEAQGVTLYLEVAAL